MKKGLFTSKNIILIIVLVFVGGGILAFLLGRKRKREAAKFLLKMKELHNLNAEELEALRRQLEFLETQSEEDRENAKLAIELGTQELEELERVITDGVAQYRAKELVDDIWGITVFPITKRLWTQLMASNDESFAKIVYKADYYIIKKPKPIWGKRKYTNFYELVEDEISPRLNSGAITNRINSLGLYG